MHVRTFDDMRRRFFDVCRFVTGDWVVGADACPAPRQFGDHRGAQHAAPLPRHPAGDVHRLHRPALAPKHRARCCRRPRLTSSTPAWSRATRACASKTPWPRCCSSVDAEVATRHAGNAGMERDHGDNGDRAQAVDLGSVGHGVPVRHSGLHQTGAACGRRRRSWALAAYPQVAPVSL